MTFRWTTPTTETLKGRWGQHIHSEMCDAYVEKLNPKFKVNIYLSKPLTGKLLSMITHENRAHHISSLVIPLKSTTNYCWQKWRRNISACYPHYSNKYKSDGKLIHFPLHKAAFSPVVSTVMWGITFDTNSCLRCLILILWVYVLY